MWWIFFLSNLEQGSQRVDPERSDANPTSLPRDANNPRTRFITKNCSCCNNMAYPFKCLIYIYYIYISFRKFFVQLGLRHISLLWLSTCLKGLDGEEGGLDGLWFRRRQCTDDGHLTEPFGCGTLAEGGGRRWIRVEVYLAVPFLGLLQIRILASSIGLSWSQQILDVMVDYDWLTDGFVGIYYVVASTKVNATWGDAWNLQYSTRYWFCS